MDNHKKLKELIDWCKQTAVLHVWVNFQDRNQDWAVRVLTNARGKAHPLRTCTGNDLETVCEELLPKAQKTFEEQKKSIMENNKKYEIRQKNQYYKDMKEIEYMHHSADDF